MGAPHFVYEQKSGKFYVAIGAEILPIGKGYAGFGAGRNSPDHQYERNIGPLPVGWWYVNGATDHHRLGPVAFHLRPEAETETKGRSGFLIHGDNATGNASRGCIILDRAERQRVRAMREHFGITGLWVIP